MLTTQRLVAGLLAAAAVLRLVWLFLVGKLTQTVSESDNIAVALATTGRFADAFGAGTGPTAHLAPTTPLLTALAYTLFGVGSPLAMLILSLIALATVLLSFWLVFRVFSHAGAPTTGLLAALAAVCLLPLQFSVEMRDLRSWEAGQAAVAIAAMLLWLMRLDQQDRIDTGSLVRLGIANGLIGLINPSAGLASSGMIGVLLLRRIRWTRWPVPVGATLLVLALVLVPWGLRNQRELGSFVLLRTGLGISRAVAYHDGVLTMDRGSAYRKRFDEISPLTGEGARAEYMRLGEVAYNRRLAAEAADWVERHPDAVRRLRLENLRDFYAPPQWHFERWGRAGRGAAARPMFFALTSAIALVTLLVMLWRRRWHYYYIAAAVLLPVLPYIMTYSLLRYRYVISTMLIFLACDGLARALAYWRGRRAAA
ncbi:hypothetical protein [Sandarakinorhabdus rubra]|uniref:hypothetical protein n=1 Tax=Sandarakinorhabdus rubra TaxID=2672568 RepID=UPI0013DAD95C|nr:hypothetical protein [Sandarakinorhabdus rubra]